MKILIALALTTLLLALLARAARRWHEGEPKESWNDKYGGAY